MKIILEKWQPKNKFCKILKEIVRVIAIIIAIAFLVLPFRNLEQNEIFRWVWVFCAVCNLDIFLEYKKAFKTKVITPIFTVFSILAFAYMYNYWALLSLQVVICVSIVIGILELIISVAVYKTIRFTETTEIKELPSQAIQGILLGGLYVCAIILFVLGHYVSANMIFVFGGISAIMLSCSVLIYIGNGVSHRKNIVSAISFIVDVLSLLALTIYLIYLIPNNNNLQDIVLAIVASVIGGALALAGVAWTILKMDKDRKEEAKNKYKPIINFGGNNTNISGLFIDGKKFNGVENNPFENTEKEKSAYTLLNLIGINTDWAPFYWCGIILNQERYYFSVKSYIDKDECFGFLGGTVLYVKNKDFRIYLILQDLLGNEYKLPTKFDIDEATNKIVFKDVGFVCDIDTEECDEQF